MPQRMYVQLKNSRLPAYRMGIRVKSTAYGSIRSDCLHDRCDTEGTDPAQIRAEEIQRQLLGNGRKQECQVRKTSGFRFLQHFHRYSAPKQYGSSARQMP